MRRAACLLLLLPGLACGRRALPAPPPVPAPARPDPPPAPQARTLAFLGDSLTAGFGLEKAEAYPALLEARLRAGGRPWKVLNAGVSGDTTAGGAARLDWLYRSRPDVLVVALGANDGLRGIPVEETERNLRTILRRASQEGTAVLLVGIQLPENLGPAYRTRFAAVFPRLAREFRVPLLPFLLEGVALDPKLNLPDRIHPNAEGHRRVADHLWPALDPVLRGAEGR
jgi:acyl-CoA thioesterase-1